MRTRELYGQYHGLIDDLAWSAMPGSDWPAGLKSCAERFESEVEGLDSTSVEVLRRDLCVQFEHEAPHSTRPLARMILFVAVKRLEPI